MDEYQDPTEPPLDDGGYLVGGTNPNKPPSWVPGPGWWEFVNGVWRWISDPAPTTVTR
ncbi:MAG TPA: hypothetical protein VFR37_10340 [Longimicrobium sp.]|nr:hypothetical protein [Longimicrobium sp.]